MKIIDWIKKNPTEGAGTVGATTGIVYWFVFGGIGIAGFFTFGITGAVSFVVLGAILFAGVFVLGKRLSYVFIRLFKKYKNSDFKKGK